MLYGRYIIQYVNDKVSKRAIKKKKIVTIKTGSPVTKKKKIQQTAGSENIQRHKELDPIREKLSVSSKPI